MYPARELSIEPELGGSVIPPLPDNNGPVNNPSVPTYWRPPHILWRVINLNLSARAMGRVPQFAAYITVVIIGDGRPRHWVFVASLLGEVDCQRAPNPAVSLCLDVKLCRRH